MAEPTIKNASAAENNANTVHISDDDHEDCDDFAEDESLLEEVGSGGPRNMNLSVRGPYERAWTTDATRALIHIRGPMEGRFTEGRQKRTALWLQCTRQLQKLGYRYSAAKVQKKWHNILITYNKNLNKKYMCGYVHWEFFEEMFKYLQGKKADFDANQSFVPQKHQQSQDIPNFLPDYDGHVQQQINGKKFKHHNDESIDDNCHFNGADQLLIHPQVHLDTKSTDDFDEDSASLSEFKQPKLEPNDEPSMHMPFENSAIEDFKHSSMNPMPDNPTCSGNASVQGHSEWWKDYFERKLLVDKEKLQLQRDMHRDLMQINRSALVQQEKFERIKIDAVNSLTFTLQKLVESKSKHIYK